MAAAFDSDPSCHGRYFENWLLTGCSLFFSAAVYLSRLEEELQIEAWGMVEGGHDIVRADQNVRVAAPLIFSQLYKQEA